VIVALFPDLLAVGGIQRAGRHTAAVLDEYAKDKRRRHQFVSLNDPAGAHRGNVGELEFAFEGFGRAKARFVTAALRQALGRPRLILAAHPNLAPLASAMKAIARDSRTLVFTYGKEVWKPLTLARTWALRRADLVLAISSDTARHLRAVHGLREDRVRCVPLGLDPEFSCAAAASCSFHDAKDLAAFPHGRVVLTVGRQSIVDRDKGIDLLIQAMPRLACSVPDAVLIVVGDGADREQLQRMARALGVGERVHFWGNVRPEGLAAAYRRCDVFALPSKQEGFGLVFIEAMAFGKPVVGGAHGGTLDVIADGITGYLVPHGDLNRLTQALERLLKEARLRDEIGRRAQERVRSMYLFEHFRARLTAVLDEALEPR